MPDVQIPGQGSLNRRDSERNVAASFAGTRELARGLTQRVYGASTTMFDALNFTPLVDDQPFAKAVKVAPKQSVEVEIPVGAGTNFGITFMGDPMVSATLIDDKGAVVGKNLANSPESRGWFRSIFLDKPTVSSRWSLKLENTGDFEYEVVLTTWKDAIR